MGRIPDELVNRIIEENDIVDVISEFIPLKNSGSSFMGVCPFHLDKGPSLSVSREKQLYHCFGCNASGNTIGFIMSIKNIGFLDALEYLANRIGISIEKERSAEKTSDFKMKNEIYEVNREAAKFFLSNLFKNKKAHDYLISRGIDEKTIKRFGLGYSLNDWKALEKHLIKKGFSKDIVLRAGLTIKSKNGNTYDRFRNRIIFPVFAYKSNMNAKNKVIGFGGRVLDDSKPKYLNSPETPVFFKGTNLYGMNFVIKDRVPESIIIVEGYMDLIALNKSGITNVVASLGTALTESQAKLIRKYTRDVYLCYDSDSAGQKATFKGINVLSKEGCNVKIIKIPSGKDPDEFIKYNSVEGFKEIIKKALSIIDYKLAIAKEGFDFKNDQHISEFARRAVKIISSLNSEVEIQYYAKMISEEIGIKVQKILDDVRRNKNNIGQKEKAEDISSTIVSGYKKSEALLIAICLNSKDYFKYIKEKVNVEEFVTPCYKILLDILYKSLEKGEDINESNILAKFETKNDINDVALAFSKEIPNDINKNTIDSYIKVIKRYNIERQIKDINNKIKYYEKNGDNKKTLEFFNQLIILRKQLGML